MTPQAARAVKAFIVVFAVWTAFGFLSSVHFFFQDGPDARFGETASHIIVFYWGWAILTPPVVILVRRVTNAARSVARKVVMLLTLGATAVAMHEVLYPILLRLLAVDPQAKLAIASLRAFAVRHGGGDVATFAVLVGACLLFDANRRERTRALIAAELEVELARAELELLRWQLHPHFLFNALNTVSTLVLKGDQHSADRAIGLISTYLRNALAQRADSIVPLRDELATVRRYIDVERLRFGDALTVDESADENTLDAPVPGSILQPLVENAIRHGYGRAPDQGRIRIDAHVADGRLRITVRNPTLGDVPDLGDRKARHDSAVSPDENNDATSQFGLRYVRERLEQFYGIDASFDLLIERSGTTATLDLPLQRSVKAFPPGRMRTFDRAPIQ